MPTPTPVDASWVDIVAGCTVELVASDDAELLWHAVVSHPNITTAGTIVIVDVATGVRIDAYRVTWEAMDPEEQPLGLRYLAPPTAGVSRGFTNDPTPIDDETVVTAYFSAAHGMELAFVAVFGPLA